MKLKGWAQDYLNTMLNGLTGHLQELFYPFNTDCWLKQSFQDGGLEGWWPYEQVAYWLDGYIKCAYFANNEHHFNKAKKLIDDALSVCDSTGFIGSSELKYCGYGNQWVHAVFFRAVIFLYEITQDKKYLDKIKAHYLSNTNDYTDWRETANIENIIMCYIYTGDERLKTLAISAYNGHCKKASNKETKLKDLLKKGKINLHAVTYNELVKIPALLYVVTGDKRFLLASIKGIERIEKNHMLPIGIHSCSENFSGTDSLAGIETCNITDFCWSLGYLAQITGNVKYLDMIEKIMYNVAPSVMDSKFTALQYFSSENQVISTFNSNHTRSFTQTPRMAYQSDHYPECCTGNANRNMPNFIYRAIMRGDSGYYFNFYIPGEYFIDEGKFSIITNYPNSEKIEIVYNGKEQSLNLKFRVPMWCKKFKYESNFCGSIANNWLQISGDFNDGDHINLFLISDLSVITTNEGFMIEKKPIIFTLKIKPKIEIDTLEKRQAKFFPAFNITPSSKWQIAIDKALFINTAKLKIAPCNSLFNNNTEISAEAFYMDGVELEKKHTSEIPVSSYDKIELVKLRKMGQHIYEGDMIFTPSLASLNPKKLEKVNIKLVPYATAALRWTIFPDAQKFEDVNKTKEQN